MNERELLVDCLHRLNRSGVILFYLTGSMASNYWGIPRTTHDLDFVVQQPMSAVPRIMQEFSGDFYIEEAAARAAYQPPYQFTAIDTRSALKVDFQRRHLRERDGQGLQLVGSLMPALVSASATPPIQPHSASPVPAAAPTEKNPEAAPPGRG